MPNTRLLAINALLEIFQKDARPKQSVESRAVSLDKRDRAFLMEIVYGVLRFRDTLDWIMKHFLKNPSKLGDFIVNNLRIALYQMYFMRVPDWAVVNESVEIEKVSGGINHGKAALVNAVLRNVIRQKDRFAPPFAFDNPISNISINTSHPKWMIKRWVEKLGQEEAARLAEANNKIPPMTIRVNSLKTSRDELLRKLSQHGIIAEPTSFSPDGILLKEVRIYDDLSFIEGLFVVQDEASQLITCLLDPMPGERILDACAAPGGKTTHIAQMIKDTGEIVSVEKDSKRIARLTENIEMLGLKSVTIRHADSTRLENIGMFDRILVDAPCSATGVIRRNPDVKYRHSGKDLIEYGMKQIGLLRSVSKLLKENGRLVFSVCSTEPEEGEQVVKDFLKTEREFCIIDAEAPLLKNFSFQGVLRTYPHRDNMDGFFGVAFCRKK
jgi:16S rRNA (cytosine967-C5)-methyltransferase